MELGKKVKYKIKKFVDFKYMLKGIIFVLFLELIIVFILLEVVMVLLM